MSESYQKARKEFKELDFADRLTFVAESVLWTGQSAVVGSLNLAGGIFDTITGTVGAVIDASGIGNLLGNTGGVVGETIDRVAITVKDASRTAGQLYSSAVDTVENVTGNAAEAVGDVGVSASEAVKSFSGSFQKPQPKK